MFFDQRRLVCARIARRLLATTPSSTQHLLRLLFNAEVSMKRASSAVSGAEPVPAPIYSMIKNFTREEALTNVDKKHLCAGVISRQLLLFARVQSGIKTRCTSKNNTMKALILCLYTATTFAWPSGMYILDGNASNQFYNPFTEPHQQLNFNINFRGDGY